MAAGRQVTGPGRRDAGRFPSSGRSRGVPRGVEGLRGGGPEVNLHMRLLLQLPLITAAEPGRLPRRGWE